MRRILVAAAVAACAAAPAFAQTQTAASQTQTAASAAPYAGTWGFQSEDYGNDDYGLAMSGVAVISPAGGANRYTISLLTQQQLTERESGETHTLVAHEACTGDASNGQLAITCQAADPLRADSQPDSFLLQRGENADQMVGALTTSQSNGETTFNRVH
jgi:hypothetical protein